jgi:hypothetical protein
MATPPDTSVAQPNEPLSAQPSDAEIEEWAAHERQRREAWLKGPTEEQKAAWAQRERERRLAELEGTRRPRLLGAESSRLVQRYLRDTQLAAEGAMSLLFKLSLSDAFQQLVRAGREWEEEYTRAPTSPRVALETNPAEREASPSAARPPTKPEAASRPD